MPLLPSLNATATGPMQTAPTFTSYTAWQNYMAKVPTPQTGCFVANYPSVTWQSSQCAAPPPGTETVGNGVDWVAQAPAGKTIGTSRGSFSTAGLTTETDKCVAPFLGICGGVAGGKGPHYFGLQINSNFGGGSFPVTYFGNSVPGGGWEQFVFLSRGPFLNCPTALCGLVWIEFWLFGYFTAHAACPPAAQDPGPGVGWFASGGNCVFNAFGALTPARYGTDLGLLNFWGEATPTFDIGLICYITTCYATGDHAYLGLYKHWTDSEFNVVGYINGSRAEFNLGTRIDVENLLFDQKGNLIAPACLKTGYTGETNNLNLSYCLAIVPPGYTSIGAIAFTERN